MSQEIAYRLRCEPFEDMSTGRKKVRGGCGDRPLHRDLARKGHIVCDCGLEWPFVKLVTIWPEGFGGNIENAQATSTMPEVAPEPPKLVGKGPASTKLLAKLRQGDLF